MGEVSRRIHDGHDQQPVLAQVIFLGFFLKTAARSFRRNGHCYYQRLLGAGSLLPSGSQQYRSFLSPIQ